MEPRFKHNLRPPRMLPALCAIFAAGSTLLALTSWRLHFGVVPVEIGRWLGIWLAVAAVACATGALFQMRSAPRSSLRLGVVLTTLLMGAGDLFYLRGTWVPGLGLGSSEEELTHAKRAFALAGDEWEISENHQVLHVHITGMRDQGYWYLFKIPLSEIDEYRGAILASAAKQPSYRVAQGKAEPFPFPNMSSPGWWAPEALPDLYVIYLRQTDPTGTFVGGGRWYALSKSEGLVYVYCWGS
jgi:hypothetical protein